MLWFICSIIYLHGALKRFTFAKLGSDATEKELEALAIYMGHSLEMQKGTCKQIVVVLSFSNLIVKLLLYFIYIN